MTESERSQTPRTDALAKSFGPRMYVASDAPVALDFARQLERDLATATQRAEAAEADARRYRWLREQLDAQSLLCKGGDFFRHQPGTFDSPPLADLDAAIDAALRESTEKSDG